MIAKLSNEWAYLHTLSIWQLTRFVLYAIITGVIVSGLSMCIVLAAGAGEPEMSTSYSHPGRASVYEPREPWRTTAECRPGECDLPGKLRITTEGDCLATMTAAMRAMEPYQPLKVSIDVQEWVARVLAEKSTKNLAVLAQEGEARAKQYAAIGQQWAEAKRCWSK